MTKYLIGVFNLSHTDMVFFRLKSPVAISDNNQVAIFSTPYYIMNAKSLSGVTYLANAVMECSERQLLNGFNFQNLDDKKFRYNYDCTNVKQELSTETVTNPWTDYLGWYAEYANSTGDVAFLDRQNVDCSGKGYLASFQMEVDYDSEKLRYVYKCGHRTLQEDKCGLRTTTPVDSENFFLPTLRHHHVHCKDDEVLRSFWLKVDYILPRGHVWYDFSCCAL